MISYAQNFEDVILRRVFADKKDGFYIDVGAADPMVDSVTKTFYDEGWSGINIEPNEFFYQRLLAERPRDMNLNVALGEREEDKELFLFERVGNSTFDAASRDRYVERGFETKPISVRTTTLAAICREYVTRPIDFLKIDCEGWEKFVIQGADWIDFRPTVVIVEATEPGTTIPSWDEWEPSLLEFYEMAYFDGLNRFYLRRDSSYLRQHFELPPNFHDNFQVYATAAAEWGRQVLANERPNLIWRIADLEANLGRTTAEHQEALRTLQSERDHLAGLVRELEERAVALDQALLKSRLWIGQLSQDLAASKLRQQP